MNFSLFPFYFYSLGRNIQEKGNEHIALRIRSLHSKIHFYKMIALLNFLHSRQSFPTGTSESRTQGENWAYTFKSKERSILTLSRVPLTTKKAVTFSILMFSEFYFCSHLHLLLFVFIFKFQLLFLACCGCIFFSPRGFCSFIFFTPRGKAFPS